MREVLFRGKRLDNGEWVLGNLVRGSAQVNPGRAYICPGLIAAQKDSHGNLMLGGFFEVDPETVGQFTGLFDLQGRKTFEGDIIRIPNNREEYGQSAGEVYVVYFGFGGFRLKPKYKSKEIYADAADHLFGLLARSYCLENDGDIEVVGNIFDTPEILER